MSNYFSKLPDFEYVSRKPNAKISEFIPVKNLFKRGFIREDILQNVAFFNKYTIDGDDRPYTVAYNVYDSEDLDWLVLACNNIINVQSEWPMTQEVFNDYLLKKYKTYEKMSDIHHYETSEVRKPTGEVILEAGLEVDEGFTYTFSHGNQIITENPTVPVTCYEYEEKLENKKRQLFLLKPQYVHIVLDDLDEMMKYARGADNYINKKLKRADNIRLY